jgi:hypothetical protein
MAELIDPFLGEEGQGRSTDLIDAILCNRLIAVGALVVFVDRLRVLLQFVAIVVIMITIWAMGR